MTNNDNDKDDLNYLIEKELKNNDKMMKPDCTQKAGRELLVFYLQSKFKQLYTYDSKSSCPIFKKIKSDFLQNFSKRLITIPNKKIMIGITGESSSGKSTICRAISDVIKSFNLPVTILTTDNYFNDISELIKKYGSFDELRNNGYDIDSPLNFQLDILKEDLNKLSDGIDIYAPEYLPNGTGISVPKSKFVPSNKIIIIEGIASMYEGIKDIFDVKVYVEANDDIRRERFLRRAYTERNQDIENAKKHWDYIVGAGEKYVQPAKDFADLILNGSTNMNYFIQLLEYIHTITNNFENV